MNKSVAEHRLELVKREIDTIREFIALHGSELDVEFWICSLDGFIAGVEKATKASIEQ